MDVAIGVATGSPQPRVHEGRDSCESVMMKSSDGTEPQTQETEFVKTQNGRSLHGLAGTGYLLRAFSAPSFDGEI